MVLIGLPPELRPAMPANNCPPLPASLPGISAKKKHQLVPSQPREGQQTAVSLTPPPSRKKNPIYPMPLVKNSRQLCPPP